MLRELMSEDLLFAKIAEPEMTPISFNHQFRDRMGKVDREHIDLFPKLWTLRPYDKMNGEIMRIYRLMISYQNVKEETKSCSD